ncbi:hypothetical protein [Youngiibacter multivorans]|uniref:Transposase n=1 Tax=Youngiibacter multivorans TaxID=937251 RepID=A0ABS4G357_9CLOT|nr:hypothetical protein [Youngiibacter multivorans]MBP1918993.1 hypothetical protein [Youngiibacter multivorans]
MHFIEKIMAKAEGWKPVEICKIIMVSVDFVDFDTLDSRQYVNPQGFSGFIFL